MTEQPPPRPRRRGPVHNSAAMRHRLRRRRGAGLRAGRNWAIAAVVVVLAVAAVGLLTDPLSVPWGRALSTPIVDIGQFFSEIGRSSWVLVPSGLLLILLLLGDWSRTGRRVAAAWAEIGALTGYLFWSVAGAGIVANILKQITGRLRPAGFAADGGWVFDPF